MIQYFLSSLTVTNTSTVQPYVFKTIQKWNVSILSAREQPFD